MYYDIQVKLTQGWFAVQRDLEWLVSAEVMYDLWTLRGFQARLVPHLATV